MRNFCFLIHLFGTSVFLYLLLIFNLRFSLNHHKYSLMERLVSVHLISIKCSLSTVFIMAMVRPIFLLLMTDSSSSAVPCVIALLPGRSANVYKHLFQSLQQEAKQLRLRFQPDVVMTDFEPGLINAVNHQVCFLSSLFNQYHLLILPYSFCSSFLRLLMLAVIFTIPRQSKRGLNLLGCRSNIKPMKRFEHVQEN